MLTSMIEAMNAFMQRMQIEEETGISFSTYTFIDRDETVGEAESHLLIK